MARIRTIKPQFYDDIKIGRLSRDARYLYIALWVFADDVGVVNGDTIWLKSKVFPYDQIQIKQFEDWISELVRHGFIRLLSHDGERFLYLPNFTRHQVINRPNYNELNIPKTLLDKELNAITDSSLINHGTITDSSLTIKGEEKEGNKKGTNVPKENAAAAATHEPHEPSERYSRFQQWLAKECPYILKHFEKTISEREFEKLLETYSARQLCDVISEINNRADLRKRYTDLYRTALNWLKRENTPKT